MESDIYEKEFVNTSGVSFFETFESRRVSDVCSTIYSLLTRSTGVATTKEFKERPIHPSVGRQGRLDTGLVSGSP